VQAFFGTAGRAAATVMVVALVAAGIGAALVVALDDDDRSSSADTSAPPLAVPPATLVEAPPPEDVTASDPVKGTRTGSPLDDLPAGVTALTDFGQRPAWSPDGETIAFLDDSPLGAVWTVDVDSGDIRNLTESFDRRGFSRAYYLSNGDLLLCGPTSGPESSPEQPEAGRFTGVMSVLQAPFDEPAVPLGMPCWEGMATSTSSMRIAWNRSDIDYTDSDLVDRVVNGITEIWTGEIRDVDGAPTVVNPRKVLDREAFGSLGVFEVQDFRPPSDDELLFTVYGYQGGEVFGIDLETGEVRNYSNSSAYEEVEGVDETGDAVYVERDLEYEGIEPGALDIWELGLDDGRWERVTRFNRWAPYYASNPSVSPDGKTLAFQLSIDGETEGQGDGILLYERDAG
jgi:hypothetical protein